MLRRLLTPACVLVLAVLPLAATTTNLIGVVVSVVEKENRRGDKTWTTYEVELRNLWGFTRRPGVDDDIFKLKIANGTFFLDGKRSTAAEALKPGHLVKLQGDTGYYACYSDDFRLTEQVPESLGPDRGVYRLRLPKGASCTYRYAGKAGKGEAEQERPVDADLFLHLLCRDGAVVAAAASQGVPKDSIRVFSLPVDAGGLRIADGRVRGEVVVTLLSQGRCLLPEEAGAAERRFTIDAPLGQEKAEGTWTAGDREGTLTITGQAEPVLGDSQAVVIWTSSGTGGNRGPGGSAESISLDARFANGVLGKWYLTTFAKGGPSASTVARYELQWDGPRFSGTIELANPEPGPHDQAGTIRIEGVLIGDQLFGATSSDFRAVDGGIPGRLRGMVLRPEAPPIVGWDEGMAKRWMAENKGGDEPMPDLMLTKH